MKRLLKRIRRAKRAFTLIEMVLVIAIIVILSVIVIFSVVKYLSAAQSATMKGSEHISVAEEVYDVASAAMHG